jgi:hypothetical protein
VAEGDTIFCAARALAAKPVTVFRTRYPLPARFKDETPPIGH